MSGVWDMSRGFLPKNDPIEKLPVEFGALDQFGRELPKLLSARALGKQIVSLPILDPAGLSDEQKERAMMLYSFIGQAFVWEDWQENKVRSVIPANIAIPWCKLAEMIGRKPILSYASYALYNWERIEDKEHIVLGNICLLQNFYGGLDEEWFILPHVAIEMEAVSVILSIAMLMKIKGYNAAMLDSWLGFLWGGLRSLNDVMKRIPESCDPYIYYNRVRPFIQGWNSDAKEAPLPDGVIYEGVEKYKGKPQKFRGETGAQSSIMPALDAFFGVAHTDKLPNGSPDILKSYLTDMRNYMPVGHRVFLADLEDYSNENSLRKFVQKNKKNSVLVGNYNACVEEIIKFSEMHYDYATRYIHRQAPHGANSTATGTGGTPFMIYLKKHLDERKECLIN
jgi:indoleamine 2,3-dioxygenase